MKTLLVFGCMVAMVVSLDACNNNSVDPTSTGGSARTSSVMSGTLTGPHSSTSVDVSSLPAAITSYISTTYAGAVIKEARKDAQGNYVVVITTGSSVKLLLFKADGTFVKEADGKLRHKPGDSTHRHLPGDSTRHRTPGDSAHRPKPMPGDTTHRPKPGKGGPGTDLTNVAISALPAAITSYISTNYTGATLDKAGQEQKTGDYVVVITTSDKKHAVLLFGSDGTFKKVFVGRK